MTTLCRLLSVLLAAALALLSACAMPASSPPPPIPPTASPTAVPPPTITPMASAAPAAAPTRQATPEVIASGVPIPSEATFFEGKVDIGGRSLFLTCKGKGSPTILFDAGLMMRGEHLFTRLRFVYPEDTRVCAYDRPNVPGSNSDRSTRTRTSQDVVNDLGALLAKAALRPPYLLIGQSFGGMNMTLFAAQRPQEVIGLILLDPLPPGAFEEWARLLKDDAAASAPPAALGSVTNLLMGSVENIDIAASSAALAGVKTLGDTAALLIASTRELDGWSAITDPALRAKLVAAWNGGRAFYARITPALQVLEFDEGHLLDGPGSNAAVSKALAAMTERARARQSPVK